jgi:hypothetical protein
MRNEIQAAGASHIRASQSVAVEAGTGGGTTIPDAVRALEDVSPRVIGEFLDTQCIPYLAAESGVRHPLGSEPVADGSFLALKAETGSQWLPKLEQLQAWCNDRRNMDLQTRFQHWLHGWLIIHVPSSFALLVVTAWHALVAVRFIELVR